MTVASVDFTLNGEPVSVAAGGSLLDALREQLGIRSAKDGCSPQGQCGCCTVWIDGQPRVACVTQVSRVARRTVTTVEGVADDARLSEVQRALVDAGAIQCGFCTPGFVIALASLFARDARPTRDAIRDALSGNLCRCSGYVKIVQAAERLADAGFDVERTPA